MSCFAGGGNVTLFEQFISERRYLQNVSPRTTQWYAEAFKWLDDEKPTASVLKSFVVRMRERGLKASSCNNRIRAVNAYLHWASGSELKCGAGCQHLRVIGNGIDVIQSLNGTPSVYVGGVLTVPSSISTSGVVTFSSAPANNATLAWAGNFLRLVMFDEDTLNDLALVAYNTTDTLHSVTGVKFSSVFI
jgi:hypothetical protein